MPTNDSNAGLAFGLTVVAGAATALGASVVFVPSLVRFASRRTLAAALSLSAGVMTYVSFVEILTESYTHFLDAGKDDKLAYSYSTVCFFGGVFLMLILNFLVTLLLGGHNHHDDDPLLNEETTKGTKQSSETSHINNDDEEEQKEDEEQQPDNDGIRPPFYSDDPVKDLEECREMAAEIEEFEEARQYPWEGQPEPPQPTTTSRTTTTSSNRDVEEAAAPQQQRTKQPKEYDSRKLMLMSINTALAIALHNFPEGLATFVATLNDPKVGAVLAVAIAIHNIPEGLCVALPIYYATGNRWKAFGWAVLSGMSEPIAALLGWAVLANRFSDTTFAILFGIVSGMMVIVSVRELLPTAHRYDPNDTVATYSFMAGMAIMALSLVLFLL